MSVKINSSVPSDGLLRLLMVGNFLPDFEIERYAGGALAKKWQEAGGEVIITSRWRSRPLRLLDMLRTAFSRRHDYDVIHVTVFSGSAFIYAEAMGGLATFLGKPLTLGMHGGNLPEFAERHPARIRKLFDQACSAVCPSNYLFQKLKSFRPDLSLIPNGIDLSKYVLTSPTLGRARLIWLRAFHQIYNPAMAPAVLANLLASVPHARLTMVGPDKGDGSLEATRKVATGLGVLDRIHFTGPVSMESVPRILSEHDIFLNTTNIDNTPVSLIEAMACGLPVVSTNVGGIPYLLENGKTGLLVQPGHVDEMAAAIKRLSVEPDLAAQLSVNGRKLAESFDWDVVMPQWKRLLNSAGSIHQR